jgi:Na+/H+ antiporter NhaC
VFGDNLFAVITICVLAEKLKIMEPSEHPYQWLSLAPPLLVILLAIITRKVFISLLAGIFVGALILCNWNPVAATADFVTIHLWSALIDDERMMVFVFTILMGATIGVVNCSAGMQGLVDIMQRYARDRRGGQLTTWLLGLFVFFDDYANTMLLGTTMRKVCDRLRITREKLAFLVDSTAAPVAGLALISTWVAGEIEYVQGGLDRLALPDDAPGAFSIFIESIPYRFYVLWMLIFVALVALTNRDFSLMYRAEKRGPKINEDLDALDSSTSTDPETGTIARWYNAVIPILVTVGSIIWFMYSTGRQPGTEQNLQEIFGSADPYNSLLWGSLLGYVFTLVWIGVQRVVPWQKMMKCSANGALQMIPALGILWLASSLSNMTKESASGEDEASEQLATIVVEASISADGSTLNREKLQQMLESKTPETKWVAVAIGNINEPEDDLDASELESYIPKLNITLTELKSIFRHARTDDKPVYDETAIDQIDQWSVTNKNDTIIGAEKYPYRNHRLYTGEVLANTLGRTTPAWLVPTMVFVLAGLIAFATGTSWGTMGILMPMFIPLTSGIMKNSGIIDADIDALSHPLFLCSVGGVLAGAIFGDHCSPISDTTVLSSQASGCNHLDHVMTQMPYALTVAGLSILFGTLPIGIVTSMSSASGIGPMLIWILLPLGVAMMLAILLIFGKCPEQNAVKDEPK